jgi:hypothetical protein
LLLYFFFIGCNDHNKNEKNLENDNVVDAEKLLHNMDSLEHKNRVLAEENRIKSDTLNKIKVFDNIYFRSNNNHFKEEYLIDDIPFQIVSSSYHKELLYDFELRTLYLPGIDFEYKKQTIERVISIINVKYKSPKKINRFLVSEVADRFITINKTDIPKPNDNNNLYIDYEWIKDDIRIRLGYKIIYEKSNNKYKKMFVPILQFRDLKIAKEAIKEIEESDKQNLKNEANKF